MSLFLLPFSSTDLPAGELHSWTFAADRVDGSGIKPQQGTLPATVIGKVAWSSEKPNALLLDGKNNRAVLANDFTKAKLPPRNFTVEAWVAVNRPQDWGGIVSVIQDNGDYERGWLLGFRKSQFCFAVSSETRKRLTYLTAPTNYSPGSWYHVIGTYDGATMKLYLDGQLATSSTHQRGDIAFPPKAIFVAGAYQDDNEFYPIAGQLARVSVFDESLSADAVRARFQASKSEFPGIEATPVLVKGWPTYMRDNARSGMSLEKLELPLKEIWTYKSRHAPQPAWPPPAKQNFWHNKNNLKPRVIYDRAYHLVSDGTSVYFGSSADDKVYCLDLATGKERWSFFTEGPVRLAPTIWEGKIYVGSDDGCVYCLNAADGKLIWRYRGVTPDRQVPGNGRMISVWPVRTGVVIDGDRARFATGLFPAQGVFQFVVDAQTGKQLAKGALGFSPQGYMKVSGTKVIVAQGRSKDAELAALSRRGKSNVPTLGKAAQQYPFAWVGAGERRFGGGDGKVAALSIKDGAETWSAKVGGKVYSLAVAGGRLLASTDAGTIHCFAPANLEATARTTGTSKSAAVVPPAIRNAAHSILQKAGVNKGYCLVLGSGEGWLAEELARQSQLKVIGVETDEVKVAASRRRLDEAGLYGRVAIQQHSSLDKLPFGSGLFNLVVSETAFTSGQLPASPKEIYRLLRPDGGKAQFFNSEKNWRESASKWSDAATGKPWKVAAETGWLTCSRKAIPGAGQWTHIYGEPGNTACSGDQLVRGKLSLQWFGPPGPRNMLDRHHRTVPPLTTAGRLFIPGNERIYCVDAYNGAELWEVEVSESRRVGAMRDAGNMTATKDTLYVAAGDRCYGLDARTGEQRLNFSVPIAIDKKPRDWGYVAHVGDKLFASSCKPGASRRGHSKRQINETYFDFVPIVTSDSFFCMDRQTGKVLWRYDPTGGAIINPTITIGGGRVYFVESSKRDTLSQPDGRSKLQSLLGEGSKLVALDMTTGQQRWRSEFDLREIQHHLYLCYADEKLVAVGTKNKRAGNRALVWYDLHSFDAATGKHVWSATQNQNQKAGGDHGEQDHHPAIVNGVVYQEPFAYDLHTGERRANWRFARGGHGCGTVSASAEAFFFRAGNPTMCDLKTGKNSKVTQVSRPGCWINIIPAGGLVLIPEASSGCTCDFAVQSSMALAPAGLDGEDE